LCYLAAEGGRHPRWELTEFLWPESAIFLETRPATPSDESEDRERLTLGLKAIQIPGRSPG
jgi:hypothetical protein